MMDFVPPDFFLWRERMYLLYVDDSGLATDKNCKHCVLAGLAIRDTKTFYVQQDIERILAKHPDCKNLELHGTRMRSGKGEWRSIPKETREGLLKEILGYIAAHYPNYFILFGAVLDKTCQIDVAHDEELFTQITSRFDMFLKRRFAKKQVPERGLPFLTSQLQSKNSSNGPKHSKSRGIIGATLL
ncbi:DUF3800 domain-containing protein [Hallerella porci]|nr:DUF3800 domain-containing protein [Hallerella porci]